MDGRKRGIILCAAALLVLAGVLVFQGIHRERQGEEERTSGASFTVPVTGEAAGTTLTDTGETAGSGAAVSHTDQEPGKAAATPSARTKQTASPAPGQNKEGDSGKERSGKGTSGKKKPGKTSGKKRAEQASATDSPPWETPVPARKTAVPAEPPASETHRQISLTIQCVRILDDRDSWKAGVAGIIPARGIFYEGKYDFSEGDTAYDALRNTCREKGIILDSQYTPAYGTYYIRGIGNLYEFDCGDESGWRYSVNDQLPNVGCSSYPLKDGDDVVFYYDNKW